MWNKGKWLIVVLGAGIVFFTTGYGFEHRLSQVEHVMRLVRYSVERQFALTLFPNFDSFNLAVPFHHQENALTCETAAARMALNFHGANVSEEELLQWLRFSARGPMNNKGVWGDPDDGFVGNINGSIYAYTGYGVYDRPIYELVRRYQKAEILTGASLYDITKEVVKGNPVVVWGILNDRRPRYWKSPSGKRVEAYPGLHARVLTGFEGNIRNPDKLILMDPLYGEIRMSVERFQRDWDLLKNRAVVVYAN